MSELGQPPSLLATADEVIEMKLLFAAAHESGIDTFRTSQPWCVMSAVEVRADDGRVFVNFRF